MHVGHMQRTCSIYCFLWKVTSIPPPPLLQGCSDNHSNACTLILAPYLKHGLESTRSRLLATEDNPRYNQHARAPSMAIFTISLRQHLLFPASFTAMPQIFRPVESSSSISQCHSHWEERQILVPSLGQLCKDKQRRQQELSPARPADATCSPAGLYTQSTRVRPELDTLLMRKRA